MFSYSIIKNTRNRDYSIYRLKGMPLLLAITECVVVCLVISNFSFNLSDFRNLILFSALIVQFASRILIRNAFHFQLIQFICLWLFSAYFSETNKDIFFQGRCIAKLCISSNFAINVIHSFLVSSFISKMHFYLSDSSFYIDKVGFLMFFKDSFCQIISEFKDFFAFSSTFLGFSVIYYLVFFHLIINSFIWLGRIRFVFSGVFTSISCFTLLILSSTIFFFGISFFDCIIRFNKSYVSAKTQLPDFDLLKHDDDKRFWFHCIYSSKVKTSNELNLKRDVQEYILFEMLNLASVLEDLTILSKQADASRYIHVPQPNKNYSKKYKAFDLLTSCKNKIINYSENYVLLKKYNLINNALVFAFNYLFSTPSNLRFKYEFIKKIESIILTIKEAEIALGRKLNSDFYLEMEAMVRQ